MYLARTYSNRMDIPNGAEQLYRRQGNLFIMNGATRDIDLVNPWEAENWNLTAQGRFISEHGETLAAVFAKLAGTKIGAIKPASREKRDLQVLIQRRNLTTEGSGGGGGDSNALVAGLVTKV